MEIVVRIPTAIESATEEQPGAEQNSRKPLRECLFKWLFLPGVVIMYLLEFLLNCVGFTAIVPLTFESACPNDLLAYCTCENGVCTATIAHLRPLYIFFLVMSTLVLCSTVVVFSISCCSADHRAREKWMRLNRTAMVLSILVSLLQSIPMNSIRAEYLNVFRHHVTQSSLLKLLFPSVSTLLLACFAFVFRIPFSFCDCCDRWEWSSIAVADTANGSPEVSPWRFVHYGLFVLVLADIVPAFLALLLGA